MLLPDRFKNRLLRRMKSVMPGVPYTVTRGIGSLEVIAYLEEANARFNTREGGLIPDPAQSVIYTVDGGPLLPGDEFMDSGRQWVVWEQGPTGWDGHSRIVRNHRPLEVQLTFTPASTSEFTDAESGNTYPLPGTPINVWARMASTNDPAIRSQIGANDTEVALIARWGTLPLPTVRPPGVEWGTTSPLTIQGTAGTLTVRMPWPEAHSPDGEAFLAVWNSH